MQFVQLHQSKMTTGTKNKDMLKEAVSIDHKCTVEKIDSFSPRNNGQLSTASAHQLEDIYVLYRL